MMMIMNSGQRMETQKEEVDGNEEKIKRLII